MAWTAARRGSNSAGQRIPSGVIPISQPRPLPDRVCLLFPAVELDLVRPGRAFPGFEERLQAQQKHAPFGAAMVHELHRLLPAFVLEKNDGPVAFLFEIETYFCADPFFGPIDHLPEHVLGG